MTSRIPAVPASALGSLNVLGNRLPEIPVEVRTYDKVLTVGVVHNDGWFLDRTLCKPAKLSLNMLGASSDGDMERFFAPDWHLSGANEWTEI